MLGRTLLSSRMAMPSLMRSTLASRQFSSTPEYDVVVVGGGPGGYVAAIKAAQLGLKTACVEGRGSLGGTCLNVGCIPSKALLNASHYYHQADKKFKGMGINVEGLSVDVPKMMKAKSKAVVGLTKGIEGLFKKNKVTYVKGWGKLAGNGGIDVDLGDGKSETVTAKNIIIATGSEPSSLPGIEVDEKQIMTSNGALELDYVPERMVVIGAGVIGLEMGSVWSRLGSKVTCVEYLDRIVPGLDNEVAKAFQMSLKKQGIKFKLGTKVDAAVKTGSGVQLTLSPAKGGDAETLDADVVLVATGRRPYTQGLNCEGVGLEMDGLQIAVNEKWETNVPGIFAIGDVVKGAMLAHKAEEEGVAVVENIAGGHGHVNYNSIPGVIYTHPEVANVGLNEEEVKAQGIPYKKGVFPFMANSRARTVDDAEGLVKVLAHAETDRILGMHIMGPNAGELIMEGVIGIEYDASSEDLARTCHAHPTMSEAVKEACMATYDKPIHF